jgi:uncharacterized membrane protein YidH (DUF202 family)
MQGAQGLVSGVVREIGNPLIAILFTVAIVVFFFGLARFIYNADDSAEKETGKRHMVYGLLGVVVMLSAYAILRLFATPFGIQV